MCILLDWKSLYSTRDTINDTQLSGYLITTTTMERLYSQPERLKSKAGAIIFEFPFCAKKTNGLNCLLQQVHNLRERMGKQNVSKHGQAISLFL